MFGLHTPELLIILLIGSLLFGAKRLPEMGSAVARTIKEFQRSMHEVAEPTHMPPTAVSSPAQSQQQLAAPPATPGGAEFTDSAAPPVTIAQASHGEPYQAA